MTSANYVQYHGRVRTPTALATNSGWIASEDAAVTMDGGKVYQARFRVGETNDKGASASYSLQVLHSEGYNTWTEYVVLNQTTCLGIQPWWPGTFSDGDTISSQFLTSGGGTWTNGAANAATYGAAYSDVDRHITITLDNTETELEFAILIPRWYYVNSTLYEIADGDTLQFRVCLSGNVALNSYSGGTITATVNHPDDWLGGVAPETPMAYGAISDSNGNRYTIIEANEVWPVLRIMKATAAAPHTWVAQDVGNGPATRDMESVHLVKDGTKIHIFHYASSNIERHEFFMSDDGSNPDSWGTIDEAIQLSNTMDLQVVSGAILSTGEIVCAYQANDGTYESVYLKVRSTGGTWGSATEIDTASVNFYAPAIVREIGSDKVHIFYKDQTNGVLYHNSWTSGGGLGTREAVESDAGTDSNSEMSYSNPVAWQDGSDEKITIAFTDGSDEYPYSSVITNDGSPETRRQIASSTIFTSGGGSKQACLRLAVYGTDVYCFFSDQSTRDLWYSISSNDAAWDTPIELLDGITAEVFSAGVVTYGGTDYISVPYDDGSDGYTGPNWYTELELSSGDNLTANNLTSGTPVLGQPALGQKHVLTASGLTTTPVLDNPALSGPSNAIVIEGITEGGIGSSDISVTITAPSVVNSGDLLIFVSAQDGGDAGSLTENTTSDWTELDQALGTDSTLSAFYHICDGSEDSESWTFDIDTSETCVYQMFRLSNWHGSQAPEVGTMSSGSSTAADPPSLTPSWGAENENLYIAYAGIDSLAFTAGPSGYSNFVELDSSTLGGSGSVSIAAATKSINGSPENPGTFTNGNGTWNANTIAVRPSAANTDNLTADDLVSGTPVLGSPSIGQKHALSASGLSTTPVLDSPDLGQEHVLSVDELVSSAPILGNPALSESHLLTADELTSGAPVLDSPALGQEHILSADELTTTPVLDTPVLGQEHVLSADELTTTPVLGNPALSESHLLTADELTVTPVLDIPVLGQEHVLSADELTVTPVLDSPVLGQEHILSADELTTTPVLGNPALSESHLLNADDLTVGAPVLDSPVLGQEHALVADDLIVGAPVLDSPVLGQEHVLTADELTTTPVLGNPILTAGETESLTADDLTSGTPVLDSPALGQEHALSPEGLSTTPVLDSPALGQEHALSPEGLSTTPILGNPALSESHLLSASELIATPVLGTPELGQVHNLEASELITTPILDSPIMGQQGEDNLTADDLISGAPVLGEPELGQIHNLTADGLVANPILDSPNLSIIHNLQATDLTVTPVLDGPALGQIHALIADGLLVTPVMGAPSLDIDIIEYPVNILVSAVYPDINAGVIHPDAEVNAVYPEIETTVITEV